MKIYKKHNCLINKRKIKGIIKFNTLDERKFLTFINYPGHYIEIALIPLYNLRIMSYYNNPYL